MILGTIEKERGKLTVVVHTCNPITWTLKVSTWSLARATCAKPAQTDDQEERAGDTVL